MEVDSAVSVPRPCALVKTPIRFGDHIPASHLATRLPPHKLTKSPYSIIMTSVPQHLSSLIASTADEGTELDRRAIDEWTRISIDRAYPDALDDAQDEISVDHEWDSVLDTVRQASSTVSDGTLSPLASKLVSKYGSEPILYPLSDILSSSKADDVISEELAELLGFEELELVTEVLGSRSKVAKELASYLHSSANEPIASSSAVVKRVDGNKANSLDSEAARLRMEESLRANANRPLFTGTAHGAPEILPHVYTSASVVQGNVLSHLGTKYLLPIGTDRHLYEEYEEVIVPPARPVPPRSTERLILVSELDELAKGSFPGKTDVAMLSILRVLDQHRASTRTSQPLASTIQRDDFKIIYVAPMKALAAEIVRKLGKRLQWLSIRVRELTGDMQLTKAEIAETQIIVTTPEKWDVVTRKPTGEGEVVSKVKLLIIDEVHLLNDERGAVIETIVARTLRQVESSQSVIRIIGLSATLPNYIDVADFLSVNRYSGLFYFDSSFRPVPLEQHFIGIRGRPNSPQSRKNLDFVTFEKVRELVLEGHQVMVFVHARKETVKTALALKEAAMIDGSLDEFSCEDHPSYSFFKRDIAQSKNKEMKQLFDNGFGIHHAGMLRTDRNMMERMFEARAIKVLCCTATLAWGVNLPAHAVIIKGTQVYDSSKGSFVDLSVLDVLQVFGRAGRPGLETSGVGYICTTEDKLTQYLDAVTSQNPIESKFTAGMVDALNAEISLGTVANVYDAVRWLRYTYMYVRMRKNPLQYGLPWDEVAKDPSLETKCNQLVKEAASKLAATRMIIIDRDTDQFTITDLGRIAAKYYVRHASIEVFNEVFRPRMTEADVLAMLCMSKEFDQIQVRENEVKELGQLMEAVPCAVKGGTDTSQGKVNILLQAYISGYRPEDFALVSDQAYAAQNGGRIIRALLEIAISRKWANVSTVLMGMSKAADIFYNLERFADDYTVSELAEMSAAELGELVHLNEHHGAAIRNAAKQFPTVHITCDLRPLGPDVLKIAVHVARKFNWDSKLHGSIEPFWLWVEDHDGETILQLSHMVFRQSTETLDVDFVISIPNGDPPPSVTIRFVSDRWMGAEEEVSVSFEDLVMPSLTDSHSPQLDIPFLSLDVLQDAVLEDALSSRFSVFNAIQSQVFWTLAHTRLHALLCAPTGCGKSTVAQMALWRTLRQSDNGSWALIVTPRRSILLEQLPELESMSKVTGISVEILTADSTFRPLQGKAVRLITASDLLSLVSRGTHDIPRASLSALRMVLCENLELLDSAYELGLSLLLHATQQHPTRYVGLSNSLNDPADLAAWLDVGPSALYSFRPSDRDQALTVSTHTFTIPQSAALFKAMAKPAHAAIQSAFGGPAIVFVPSQALCRSVALDLTTQCALESESAKGYLPDDVSAEALELHLARLRDRSLVDFVSRGIGFFHDGIPKEDRTFILQLYAEGIVRVLVVPHYVCWTLPVRAATVVVMGTQYFHVSADGQERRLREYELEELVRMQGRAVRHNETGRFHLFCQTESKDTFTRFLSEGLPLESKLLETDRLRTLYRAMRSRGRLGSKQDDVDMLSFTFLARRVESNPIYYNMPTGSRSERLSRIVDSLERAG
ncbi:hypothetical protein NM688_g5040 [Phlebia brevispora]|uniref:Uncharacterized protein n=1 Tax=Phlebia brevispora TaxID=194682 RepID=A0ACC1T1E1_9APHY|nr:hypothetical protein NM688_g5040 [Phlebia brevispora]